MAQVKDLYDFLVEAELEHYYNAFKNDLKVNNIPQLKYVDEEDLADVGMTKPEMRRLKKFFKKECPQTTFSKLRKILTTKGGPENSGSVSPGALPSDKSPGPFRSASKHIIPEDAITLCKKLGSGEFGTVQQGVWTNEDGERVQVAIKCLCKEKMQSGTADFLKEATIMHGIDHEHIVRLYGVVLGADSLKLVSELAPLRSLLECIKEPALRLSFPIMQLCDFAVQIANGMAYLESKRLIHRDLSARNILVFAKDKVKVSDFGLSRALGVGSDYYQTNFSVNLKLPIAWCAPECINYLKFTSASDIWAYGVTLWEMFSYGFQPWAAFTGQQQNVANLESIGDLKSDSWDFAQKVLEAIDEPNFQRLEQPDCSSREYYELMLKCWEHDPEKRPSFQELLHVLPMLKPEQVAATKDYPDSVAKKDYIFYRVHDIITVLEKKPENPPEEGLWKGATDGSKTGFFNPGDVAPYIEINMSPGHKARAKISRKESARKSSRGSISAPVSKKLTAGMIGRPQNDLRHTGHIGYDGAVFGDVAFIGDNYDKLPVKVVTPYKPHEDMAQSSTSMDDDLDKSKRIEFTHSDISLLSGSKSAISVTSDGDTLTDVSSFHGDSDSILKFISNDKPSERSNDIGLGDDFDSFKMPDFSVTSSSLDFDLGPSFMDEVMKAIAEPKDTDAKKDDSLQDDLSPLVEKEPVLPPKKSFDNMALSVETVQTKKAPAGGKPSSKVQERETFIGQDRNSPKRPDVRPPKVPEHQVSRVSQQISSPRGRDRDSFEGRDRDSYGGGGGQDLGICSEDMFLSPSPAPSSPDIWDSQPEWSPRIENGEKKKSKPLLKLAEPEYDDDDDDAELIPSRERKDSGGVKPMSASDEKKLDQAIELANEFAELSASQNMVSSPVATESTAENGVDTSPTRKTMFGSRKKSPKAERRSFTEEIASLGEANDNMTPEAQSAYNVLVVKGSVKQKDDLDLERPNRQLNWRSRLAKQHQETENAAPVPPRNGRPVNRNIRKPAGIPGRGPAAAEEGEVDTNPLRRLRESQSLIKPRIPSRTGGTDGITNGRSNENIRRPNLNPNLPFFAKLKEQEQQQGNGSDEGINGDGNQVAVPPRQPLRPAAINLKPRERKYPLDLSSYNRPKLPPTRKSLRENLPLPPPPPPTADESEILNTTAESSDSVFIGSSSSGSTSSSIDRKKHTIHSSFSPGNDSAFPSSPFSVKSVKVTAADLGLYDNSDMFWRKQVNFVDMAQDSDPTRDENSPMPGRYKTSDNVSYEDLMEFALDDGDDDDGDHENKRGEFGDCDEVRLMRRVFSQEVTVEDCMYALEETDWDVFSAIKLVKLKQLLSTGLADKDTSKTVLMRCSWNVDEATDYILANPPDQESPDVLHL